MERVHGRIPSRVLVVQGLAGASPSPRLRLGPSRCSSSTPIPASVRICPLSTCSVQSTYAYDLLDCSRSDCCEIFRLTRSLCAGLHNSHRTLQFCWSDSHFLLVELIIIPRFDPQYVLLPVHRETKMWPSTTSFGCYYVTSSRFNKSSWNIATDIILKKAKGPAQTNVACKFCCYVILKSILKLHLRKLRLS
jgi:hypothetical protein